MDMVGGGVVTRNGGVACFSAFPGRQWKTAAGLLRRVPPVVKRVPPNSPKIASMQLV